MHSSSLKLWVFPMQSITCTKKLKIVCTPFNFLCKLHYSFLRDNYVLFQPFVMQQFDCAIFKAVFLSFLCFSDATTLKTLN